MVVPSIDHLNSIPWHFRSWALLKLIIRDKRCVISYDHVHYYYRTVDERYLQRNVIYERNKPKRVITCKQLYTAVAIDVTRIM